MASSNENARSSKTFAYYVKRSEMLVAMTCILGIILCLYTIKVEIFKSRDSSYTALCDFNEWISCSKVFTSAYGKGFGLIPKDSFLNQPNSIYGLAFFLMQLILLLFRKSIKALQMKIFLSVLANLGSVYLASILYFVLKDFCIVCVSIYIVNFFLLIINKNHYDYFKKQKANLKKKSS